MKKTICILALLSIGIFSQVGAVMQAQNTYDTFEAFQASGDAPICKVVSDGCNEWSFADGEKGDPIKACKLTADFEYSWSCAEYQDGIMFLQGGTQEDMMYSDPLTAQERTVHNTLSSELTEKEFAKISRVTEKYTLLHSHYSQKQQERYEARIQSAIQKHIDIRVKKENASTDRILLMLQYLKLELKMISHAYPIGGGFMPLSGEVYTCDNAEYRVYDADYFIDDMGFVVEKDTIHVSDGSYLLPNYIAKQEISASGVKYIGTHTETQKAYTFWMKGDEMSVYQGNTLIHTCKKK